MNCYHQRQAQANVQARAVVMVDLVPGTRVYTDVCPNAGPILVIDTGAIEVHLTIADDRPRVTDLETAERILDAVTTYRDNLLEQVD